MTRSHSTGSKPALVVRALNSGDWAPIETLFGSRGACGGCWCMAWRVPRGGKLWEQSKGTNNKRAFKMLVTSGRVKGCLAFIGDEPVGWCCVGPRADFPRLVNMPSLETEWDERTWSVVCFFIPSAWRNHGVATALLKEAIQVARTNGAKELEAYPAKTKGDGSQLPGAFAWTGVARLFDKAKFRKLSHRSYSREVYLRKFKTNG